MEEALITNLVVADDIESFTINAQDTPMELQLRMPGEEWDCIDILLDGKLLFQADWTGNLLKFFKRALEMWPEK